MKLSDDQKQHVRTSFANLQTKEDLLNLINEVLFMVYSENTKSIDIKHLNYYAYGKLKAEKCYKTFEIPKKTKGEMRTIHAPIKGLKNVQKVISIILTCLHRPRREATGFTEGMSIVNNAQRHIGRQYVWNIDLKDFFPSINEARVASVLRTRPFELVGTTERNQLSHFIAKLCCVKPLKSNIEEDALIRPCLPQGAPTSPILTNIVCRNLDRLLKNLAVEYKLVYSRYADDITFSGNRNLFNKTDDFTIKVREIIAESGFIINEKKVRLQKAAFKQEVTGIIVNNRLNVPSQYAKNLRTWFHWLDKFGIEGARLKFAVHHAKANSFEQILIGKVLYFCMVRKNETTLSGKYIALIEKHFGRSIQIQAKQPQFDSAISVKEKQKPISLEQVIDLLLSNPQDPNFDAAFQLFKQISS